MNRRALLLGLGCVGALAGAEALRPRKLLSLMGERKLTRILPTRFAGWVAEGGGDIVLPEVPGSLSDTLYNERVARNYRHANGGPAVMLLATHGDTQSDLLQLHRPEVCYRAVGFGITDQRVAPLPLDGVTVPGVELTARAGSRVEDVLYWTRLGEYLPASRNEQRTDRLRTAMAGFVADGVLIRISAVRGGAEAEWPSIRRFATDLLAAVAPADRAALIGSRRAEQFGGRVTRP